MRRMLLFAGVVLCALVVAASLRARDAPYIAYERGDVGGAIDGLTRKAKDGDGFAAYLVARSNHLGLFEGASSKSAAAWYLAAAQAAEFRAVSEFLTMVIASRPAGDACGDAAVLLDLASRTGDAGALIATGGLYENGTCGSRDLMRAASYYSAAVRLDRRFSSFRDRAMAKLSSEEAARVRPIPFDLDPREVLARFVSEAPALLPDSLR